jgi:predicted ester cyclase
MPSQTINPPPNNVSLPGFDAEFRDLDDYIRVITARIWEGGRIDDIYRYYSDPCVVETPTSVSTALEDVVRGTRATLVAFPDRRLLAEDIIQSGDAVGGFLSSHRIISTMTHLGEGAFGAPTGKKIHVRTIADCVCRDNRIIHEWLVRDQAAIALQIGLLPRELAMRWLAASQPDDKNREVKIPSQPVRGELVEPHLPLQNQPFDKLRANGGLLESSNSKPQAGRAVWAKTVANDPPDGYFSFLSKDRDAEMVANALLDFAFAKDKTDVARVYDDAVHHLGPAGATRYGQAEASQYWQTLFSQFKVASFTVEHLAIQRGDGKADRVAIRWRAKTTHEGAGQFGAATGKPVEIMGINHVELYKGRVLREWVLIDEIALWMQVLAG